MDVTAPQPGERICDPACGTGGFILAAHDYIARQHAPLDRDQWDHLRHEALHGWEIVDNTARLCVMNLYLHGIGHDSTESPIHVDDSLRSAPGNKFNMVLTNPPFGKKSSVTYINELGEKKTETLTIDASLVSVPKNRTRAMRTSRSRKARRPTAGTTSRT